MIFSVSSDEIEWTLDFGPVSVTIAVNDLNQNLTISSQEIPRAVWQLLLSRIQDFLDDHLPRVPITQSQEGTMEMRDEVLSSVGAQGLYTSSYQVSDLDDIEVNWENSEVDMDAVFRPGIDTPFSPTTFDGLSMEGSVENPIVLDEDSSSINTRVYQTHGTSQASEKSRFWSENRKGTRLCFYKFVSIGITVFVF